MQFSGNDEERKENRISGGNGEREPPVPIPNTEVKPLSAESTWLETARENRTLPDSKRLRRKSNLRNPFFVRKKQAKRCGAGRRLSGSVSAAGSRAAVFKISSSWMCK